MAVLTDQEEENEEEEVEEEEEEEEEEEIQVLVCQLFGTQGYISNEATTTLTDANIWGRAAQAV